MKTIVWFRDDLRLSDNGAVSNAAQSGQILPVFFKPKDLGGASCWWLHHSLSSLQADLTELGVPLLLLDDDPHVAIPKLCIEHQVERVVWTRVYSPDGIALGKQVKLALEEQGVKAKSFAGQLMHEPQKLLNQQGKPYRVFTPFSKALTKQLLDDLEEPLGIPKLESFVALNALSSDVLSDWKLLPSKPNLAKGWNKLWHVGEQNAQDSWQNFIVNKLSQYKQARDFPAKAQTSMLSPHFRFGEISARQCFWIVKQMQAGAQVSDDDADKFLTEIIWREFSWYLLFHFPAIVDQEFSPKFRSFEWSTDREALSKWQQGMTGYPLVDAGMRELWQTGYMHNRVRMVVGSFLIKHLGIDWRLGMQWFWDTLVDADIGNNTASWQWVAGCGADAAPYFRIFNPLLQSEKFDQQGDYLKKWLPELANLNANEIHIPWKLSEARLKQAGITLGEDYPLPMVDHAKARVAALDRYKALA